MTRLARIAMKNPVIRADRARPDGDDLRRPDAPHLERPARQLPRRVRREDGPHGRRGLVRGRRRARATASPSTPRFSAARRASARNADLAALLAWGSTRYRTVARRSRRRASTRRRSAPYGSAPLALVAPRRSCGVVGVDRPLVERVVAPAASRCRSRGDSGSARCGSTPADGCSARAPLVAARSIDRAGPRSAAPGGTRGAPLHHVVGLVSP